MLKILIIKKGAIGDLLMATPLIRQLKQSMECEIDILVGKSSAIAVKNNLNISNVFAVDDSLFSIKYVYRFIYKLYKLRANKYDFVFVLDKHWYFNLCANIIGGIKIGFEREKISKYLLDYCVKYNDNTKYHGIYNLELLHQIRPNYCDYNDLKLDIAINDAEKNKVSAWLDQNNIKNFVIVVNSGGNNAFESNGIRMIPDDKAVELIGKLAHAFEVVVLAGGKLDSLKNQQYIAKLSEYKNIINLAGEFNLAESTYLFSLAQKLFITDCGALHLAVASGNHNLVAVFGPTNPRHVLPDNLVKCAYWQDEDIYTPKYSLYGGKGLVHKKYFTNLNVKDLLEQE